MLKHSGGRLQLSSTTPMLLVSSVSSTPVLSTTLNFSLPAIEAPKLSSRPVLISIRCRARRRVRYEEEDEGGGGGGGDDDDECGHNAEIELLELYSQSARGEALLVHAMVDAQAVEVLIFKGFSSCLSYKTSPDPSKSVLPARAVINSIDRIRGPLNPSNIEYIEKGVEWNAFKTRL